MAIFRSRAIDAANRSTPLDGPLQLLRPQLRRRFAANLDQLRTTLLPAPSARRARTEELRQQDPTECGAVSLGIVLRHFGRHVPLSDLRRVCGVSRDGSDAANLVRAAQLFGLEAKGFKKGLDALKTVALPAILFWNFDHFLVLDGIEAGRYWLNDPATGRRCVELDDFDRCYTGVVLTFTPGPAFQPSPPPPSAAAQLRRWLVQEPFALLAALLGAAVAATVLLALLPMGPLPVSPFPLALLLAAALALQPLAQWQARRLQRRSSRGLQQQLLSLPSWVLQQSFSAELSGRLQLVPQLTTFVGQQLWLSLPLLLAAVLWGVLLLLRQPAVGLLLLAGLALVAWVSQWSERLERSRDAQQRQVAQRPAVILQGGLQDPETLKASALERNLWLRWSGLEALATQERQRLAYSRDLQGWIPQLLAWSLLALLVGVGLAAQLEPLPLVALALGLALVQQRGRRLLADWHQARAALASLMAVEEQPGDPLLQEPASPAWGGPVTGGAALLELEAVSFGYVPVLPPLIEGFSLRVEPGQRIAIVGGSASGKSTLARLMAGLLQPTAGVVRLDGRPLMAWSRQQRLRAIAMVQQGLPLLSCSVRDNLTFWDAAISQAQLEQACATAVILERIEALPQGFDTPLQQAGLQFSGGELQRLQIAQALLQQPALLLLDEATAALDAATEAQLERALRQLPCTQIVVAHRLSTIRDADLILVLERGKLVQCGRHGAMVAELGSPYQQLLALEEL
jgi:ATP-binding cassette subfamily B protein